MRSLQAFVALAGYAALLSCRNGQREHSSATSAPNSPARAAESAPQAVAPPATTTQAPPGAEASASPPSGQQSMNFDSDRNGATPAGFSFGRTGGGAMGRWNVRAEADAPSAPHVLAQMDADDTDFRFPIAVADAPVLRDVRLSVKCKPVSGQVDRACGLVLRYRDENNYLITRANPLENNIRLYFVKDGKRRQLASWSGRVTAGAWHEYVVEARGEHILVFWDGKEVLEHRDATFVDAGRVGLWTKADSVTYFDDLTVTPIEGGAR